MTHMFRIAAMSLMFLALSARGAEVAGIQIPEGVNVAGSELKLNGAGIRTRAVFKVYVGALYLAEKKAQRRKRSPRAGPSESPL